MSWRDSPIVSFSRGGQRFELGRGPDDPVLHLHGSTGLGLAPVEVAKSDRLNGHGSIVRNVRYGDREVFIPVHLSADSPAELTEIRHELSDLLAPSKGEVEIWVEDPARQTQRMVRGYLTDGLSGDFGDGFHGDWQNLGLVFDCPDPWWYGEERVQEWALSRIAKPFVTSLQVPFLPVVIAPSVVQGAFQFEVQGDAPAVPVWTVYPPGEDILIECRNGCGKRIFLEGPITEPVTFDAINEDITSPSMDRGELWERVSLDSEFFNLDPGMNRVAVSMVNTTAASQIKLSYQERFKVAL